MAGNVPLLTLTVYRDSDGRHRFDLTATPFDCTDHEQCCQALRLAYGAILEQEALIPVGQPRLKKGRLVDACA